MMKNQRRQRPLAPTLMPAIGTKCWIRFCKTNYDAVVIGHGVTAPVVQFTAKNGMVKTGPATVVAKDFSFTVIVDEAANNSWEYSTEQYWGRLYE
jgi:hypothetical protein